MSCYVAVFTSENRDDISTSTRQSTISSAILLNVDGSWYREFRQEMVFCACVCPYAYVAGILTCLSLCLCLCLCPSENQLLVFKELLHRFGIDCLCLAIKTKSKPVRPARRDDKHASERIPLRVGRYYIVTFERKWYSV